MSNRIQTYLICITILEGRHYIWPNMDSIVLIKIDRKKRSTCRSYSTNSPYYNEYFVFEFTSSLDDLMDKNITLTVIQPSNLVKKRKILGYITLDVATVWTQTDHQFYHKWAILTAPQTDNFDGTRGYLKVDISVITKGEMPKIPKSISNVDIEGNLLLPEGITTERQKARFIIKVYKGEDFYQFSNNIFCFKSDQQFENHSKSYIVISFAGLKIQTSQQENGLQTLWNETLILEELFPPLCQRIKFELHIVQCFQKSIVAVAYLNLSSISNDKENGFLPTFGPSYIHFYSRKKLEGFVGKVLISLTTEIQNLISVESKSVFRQKAPPLKISTIKDEEISLFATIFEVNWIDRKYRRKPIAFRMSFDKTLDQIGINNGKIDNVAHNISKAEKPLKTNKNFYYLERNERKPRLFISALLPDLRKRLYNSNLLSKIAQNLKQKLDEIKNMKTEYKISTPEIDNLMLEMLDFIRSSAAKYIDIVSAYNFTATILDQERLKLCIREMERISMESQTIYNERFKRETYRKIFDLYLQIEALIEDPQDCWPYIYLWMMQGNKKVAYHKIHPRNIVYSLIEEERGADCKKLKTIFLQKINPKYRNGPEFFDIACRMDVVMSIGLERHNQKLKFEPKGFKLDLQSTPACLIAEEKYTFLCRAHIFQGRILSGSDHSGLCDAYVQVVLDGLYRETIVVKETLSPIWDQTLTFQHITLYGEKNFIKTNPPKFLIEVYDRDESGKNELVGRLIVNDPFIKMSDDQYLVPKLKWYQVYGRNSEVTAEILAAFDCLEFTAPLNSQDQFEENVIASIPADIKPIWVDYKIEVLFWGIRHLKKINLLAIMKPKIVIECANIIISSKNLENSSKHSNFPNALQCFDISLPAQKEYAPVLSMKMFDSRCFGINRYIGTYVTSIQDFFYNPITFEERELKLFNPDAQKSSSSITINSLVSNYKQMKSFARNLKEFCQDDDEDHDWWTKFYNSLEPSFPFQNENITDLSKYRLKIYQSELELQPEFQGFTDLLTSFRMYKGKRTGDETVDEENTTGTFKGSIKIYRLMLPDQELVTDTGLPLKNGIFQDYPKNSPLRYLLRVYCIRAIGLRPKDLTGKSDPYLYLRLNDKIINDKKHCVIKDVNPVFGKCFEFNASFPQDHTLSITVYDWDATTDDDLIGETRVDLENRFYTKHRAHCGLPRNYNESGYCQWRDQHKPTVILENLCKLNNLEKPKYSESSVNICGNEFKSKLFKSDYKIEIFVGEVCIPAISDSGDVQFDHEVLALVALRRWHKMPVIGRHLVPEHVETRSLYHPKKFGIEQGKLQLWIDIFPYTDYPFPKQVNISPRKPLNYELRLIVWNVENIQLEENDFLTGEKKSDIYVKGWLGDIEQAQYTDVHYRSLLGEGNFNWRFIFQFQYLSTENKLIRRKKETFSIDQTELKIPCELILQVWDNDTISPDDFLGILTIELSRVPRGARNAKNCSLSVIKTNVPTINLFKIRRTKGWWPFKTFDPVTKNEVYTGAVELEFELVSGEDAEKYPVGLGRDEPQALPKPNRPDTSFTWFKNPLKAMTYVFRLNKWKIIKGVVFIFLVLIILLAVYAFPGYSVKKLLGV